MTSQQDAPARKAPSQVAQRGLNPYIAGNPVGAREAFVGRQDVLDEVARTAASHTENALVLYGQRRVGKTSLLQELRARLGSLGPYRTVYLDLQDKAVLPLPKVLEDVAQQIARAVGVQDGDIRGDDAPRALQEDFFPRVFAALRDAESLILLIDEFDVLDSATEAQAGTSFFPYLRGLLSLNPERLQFVFVIGRRPEDLSSIALSIFKGVKSLHVSLLSAADTTELARLSERNRTLEWTDDAVNRVYALSGGHPFLTQQLCQLVWERAHAVSASTMPQVTAADVDGAAPLALHSATSALEWLWDGLGPAERLVASALAAGQPGAITQDELAHRLTESGVRILIGELQDAPRILQDWDLIETVEGGFRFRVELLRRWIAERKPLSHVQRELDYVRPLAENLFRAAYAFYQSGDFTQAAPLLRQAVAVNPNHLRANQLLAEILLAQGALPDAQQLLETLFEYQPAAARPRLVQVLLLRAQKATNNDEKLHFFDSVLELDASQPEAIVGRQKVLLLRGETAEAENRLGDAIDSYRQAGLPERASAVEVRLRARRLDEGLAAIASYEHNQEFQKALDLARKLRAEFPNAANFPDLDRLERKTQLDTLYRSALGALQLQDRKKARELLAHVVALEPAYREATRYLHLAVTGDDPGLVMLKPTGAFTRVRLVAEVFGFVFFVLVILGFISNPQGPMIFLRGGDLVIRAYSDVYFPLALNAVLGISLAVVYLYFIRRASRRASTDMHKPSGATPAVSPALTDRQVGDGPNASSWAAALAHWMAADNESSDSIRSTSRKQLIHEEGEAATRDLGSVKTVYAPASERVSKPPLAADAKLMKPREEDAGEHA